MAELKVKTGIDGAGWTRGLEKMEEEARHFGKTLNSKIAGNFNQAIMEVVPGLTGAIAGIFSAESIKETLSEFAEKGEHIKFGALRLNIDQESFQRVEHVLQETGQDVSVAATSFDKLAVATTKIGDNAPEAGKLRQAFAELGIAAKDLEDADYQKIFFKIADAMHGVEPSKEQVAALREVFGKGGDNLLPAFEVGFNSEFANKGVINDQDLATIKNYNDEMRKQGNIIGPVMRTVKADALASVAALSFVFNPFRWAAKAGESEEDGYHKKFMEDEQKRLNEIEANKRKAAALQEALHKANEKFDKEDAKKAAAVDKETEAIKERNRVDGLSPAAKRLELMQQIKQIEGELKYGGGDLTKEDEAKMRKHLEELKHEISGIKDEKPHHAALSHMGNQAIGGILLGHDRLNEVAAHAKSTAHHTAQIARNTTPHPSGRGGGHNAGFH